MSMRKVPETPLTCEVRAALEEYTQRLMNIYPERFIESDPESWREENRKKQAAGVKFEKIGQGGLVWLPFVGGFENGNKEDYREVPQEVSGVKPMKLTAKICRVGKAYPMSYSGQGWEFTGTREEYRAECEKYGYVVVSEIKEVVEKPETVKYYFAMLNRYRCTPFGRAASDKDQIIEYAKKHRYTIIGDIEEREVET